MRAFLKKSIAWITCISFTMFSITAPVYASEEIVTVSAGEPAPFSGTLFNTEAAARLLVDLETSQTAFELQCSRRLDVQKADMQLEIDIMQASRDALQMRYDDTLIIKNDHIDFLERQTTKKRIPPEAIFIIGVLSGVGLTLGSAYALGQVAQN